MEMYVYASADTATDATVLQRNRVTTMIGDQLGIDIDITKIVDQHSEFGNVRLGKQLVQEGGFPGTQKTTDDRKGNGVLRFTHGMGCHTPASRVPRTFMSRIF